MTRQNRLVFLKIPDRIAAFLKYPTESNSFSKYPTDPELAHIREKQSIYMYLGLTVLQLTIDQLESLLGHPGH